MAEEAGPHFEHEPPQDHLLLANWKPEISKWSISSIPVPGQVVPALPDEHGPESMGQVTPACQAGLIGKVKQAGNASNYEDPITQPAAKTSRPPRTTCKVAEAQGESI